MSGEVAVSMNRGDGSLADGPPPIPPHNFRPSPRVWRWSLILFLLTCASTFFAGMVYFPQFPPEVRPGTIIPQLIDGGPQRELIIRSFLWSGFQYSAAVMSILLVHELGHFLQARRYHVPAIPPMFIPMPIMQFGTMGAVIVQSSGHADRKALFDIAITGPLAGLCLALPIAWFGVQQSETMILDQPGRGFGDPPIMQWMLEAVHGPLGPNEHVMINPLLMAGWVGIFVTALNLAPVGQLDGGHILYCLIGRRAHAVALSFVALVMAYMVLTRYWIFSLMIVLLFLMGLKHPPTTNDRVPLGRFRIALGWLTLAFLFIGMSPRPLEVGPTEPQVERSEAAIEPTSRAAPSESLRG